MRVRLRREARFENIWSVDTWVWYWPFWIERYWSPSKEASMEVAKRYKTTGIKDEIINL